MQFQLTTDRGKLRMERLRQLELEQLQWEQEALVMPEVRPAPFISADSRNHQQDLNRALFLSFESVKTEFSDLDGLSWSRYPVPLVINPWAVEEPTPKLTCTEIDEFPTPPDSCDLCTPVHSPTFPAFSHHSQCRPPPKPLPYASSSRSPDMTPDTIRVSRLAQSSRSPLQPANQFFSPQCNASHKDPLTHGLGSPYTLSRSHPPANLALACHSPRRSPYGRS
ncbi:hypothetical protein JVT61DRAFT_7639 [Boletus reticuloceps]|uniref:Uncharacterized protein n=1 Tax=Boletus reticuloceps TaxID=495285 RepID=A0A8I3A6Z8_9AGAM|nr:hypothetical protein JVT61DRAFT_7639 [Boletus reticuloceps]